MVRVHSVELLTSDAVYKKLQPIIGFEDACVFQRLLLSDRREI